MNKESSIEAVNTSNLSDQTKFRLNKINEIKVYFNYLIVLSATSGGISVISFANVLEFLQE